MSKRSAWTSLFALFVCNAVTACGSDTSSGPDRVGAACNRIMTATCDKFIECRATANGIVFTDQICQQIMAQSVANCRTKQGAGIAAASDADIDACVLGFEQFQCQNLCNQVPQDPPACAKIDPTPGTETITCAP